MSRKARKPKEVADLSTKLKKLNYALGDLTVRLRVLEVESQHLAQRLNEHRSFYYLFATILIAVLAVVAMVAD